LLGEEQFSFHFYGPDMFRSFQLYEDPWPLTSLQEIGFRLKYSKMSLSMKGQRWKNIVVVEGRVNQLFSP